MKDKIFVFTLDGCSHCTSLKKRLDENSIPYKEIEITVNENIWNQVVNQTGYDNVPTVYIQKENSESGPGICTRKRLSR